MISLKVKVLSSEFTAPSYIKKVTREVSNLADSKKFTFDYNAEHPEILFFTTGGTEQQALDIVAKSPHRFFLLIGIEVQNGYAAACEVKARLQQDGVRCWLTDFKRAKKKQYVEHFGAAFNANKLLAQQTLGIIGKSSDWLVASSVQQETLKEQIGLTLKEFPWEGIPSYKDHDVDTGFMNSFTSLFQEEELRKASQVHTLFKKVIADHHLDGLTVECFSLVAQESVSGCLSLGLLNGTGTPAGCEGDITAAVAMMVAKALGNNSTWMANLVELSRERVQFAHCTVPTDMVSNMKVLTHFETDKGTAIRGELAPQKVAIFRFNNTFTKAFLTKGVIIKNIQDNNSCRTKIEVKLSEKSVKLIKQQPLGNHHIIALGETYADLKYYCKINNIEII